MRAFALLAELQVETNTEAPGVVATATGGAIAVCLLLLFNAAFQYVVTAVHEGGHALGFALFGAGVKGVHVKRKADATGRMRPSGLTEPHVGLRGLDWVVTAAVGYLAPPLVGLLIANLLAHGRADAVLWASAVGFGLLGLMTKNWFGRFVVFSAAFVFFLIARRATPFYELIAACTWAWMLLTGGLQRLLEVWWDAGDFANLQKRTLIPDVFWAVGYLWLIVVIAIEAGLILVGAKEPFL